MQVKFEQWLARSLAASLAFAAALASAQSTDLPNNNVPEPGTWALVGLGVAALVAVARKRRK